MPFPTSPLTIYPHQVMERVVVWGGWVSGGGVSNEDLILECEGVGWFQEEGRGEEVGE